jgi:ribosomal protein S18 acetylase RimI-like enzyme
MEYRLRPSTAKDEPFLKELFYDVRAVEFLPLQLPQAALHQLLEMQYRAQKSGYEQQFPDMESSIVWVGPYRVGRILVSSSVDAIQLVDIALLAAFRGHGIGRGMIDSLCQRALEAGVPLRLSVRKENRAMKLYKRLGFVRRGERGLNVEMEWGEKALPDAAVEQAVNESGPVVPGPNGAYFRSICGTRAIVRRDGAERVELKLASVRALRKDADASVTLGDSFALIFEGDSSALLAQRIYELEFEDGYRMDLFLVPVAAANGMATYESIFNRMERKASGV